MRIRMSLIPRLFSHWWETLEQPHRLRGQRFGMGINPEEFLQPSVLERLEDRRWSPLLASPSSFYNYYRPWADLLRDEDTGGWSVVKNDKDKFHVTLDVQHFKPDEINVKIVDNYIIVEGKHEEKEDEHGIISRQFVRKYLIPDQCDPEKATSSLSSDGVLTITAPRKPEAIEEKKERVIKIEHTGKPALENEEEKKSAIKQ
ncbi:PREDICTED: protein lethal(2)essential for life-like [Polistes dominula]|uniref:Protein lethal(2)essential for life-like n=1 Tax=Polistes dominula TaxID=743375 RepID=A0ABM1HYP1_POLDO|nr:PREDICTED: protein lethal(2)essential for life-like [Polistes dominula]